MFITTPVRHADWLLKMLEAIRLVQKRTSAHCNLVYLRNVVGFMPIKNRTVLGIAQ